MAEISQAERDAFMRELREDIEFEQAVRSGTYLPAPPSEFPVPPLPAGVDPTQPMTYGDFIRHMAQFEGIVSHQVPKVAEIQARKVALCIGPTQEAEVLAANPIIGSMPIGPARDQAICDRFVVMQRRKRAQEEAQVVQATQAAQPTAPSVPATPEPQSQPHVVPDPEMVGHSIGTVQATSPNAAVLEALRKEYAELPQKYRNAYDLAEARKRVTRKIYEASGQDVLGELGVR